MFFDLLTLISDPDPPVICTFAYSTLVAVTLASLAFHHDLSHLKTQNDDQQPRGLEITSFDVEGMAVHCCNADEPASPSLDIFLKIPL